MIANSARGVGSRCTCGTLSVNTKHANLSTIAKPSPSRVSHADTHVLLGLSESELQQVALNFGRQSYRGKQLHHLIYQRKVKDIQDFSQLPQAFRNELQEAGWWVGRSPVYRSVTAADGTF